MVRSKTSKNFGIGAKDLEPANSLELIKKAWWLEGWYKNINSRAISDNI